MSIELVDLIPDDLNSIDPAKDGSHIGRMLRFQADRLVQKASDGLRAEVELKLKDDGTFVHTFYLLPRDQDDVRYSFFWIEHGLEEFPATLFAEKPIVLQSGEAFEQSLRELYKSGQFRRLYTMLTREINKDHEEREIE